MTATIAEDADNEFSVDIDADDDAYCWETDPDRIRDARLDAAEVAS